MSSARKAAASADSSSEFRPAQDSIRLGGGRARWVGSGRCRARRRAPPASRRGRRRVQAPAEQTASPPHATTIARPAPWYMMRAHDGGPGCAAARPRCHHPVRRDRRRAQLHLALRPAAHLRIQTSCHTRRMNGPDLRPRWRSGHAAACRETAGRGPPALRTAPRAVRSDAGS
jgi:hypothetical protein